MYPLSQQSKQPASLFTGFPNGLSEETVSWTTPTTKDLNGNTVSTKGFNGGQVMRQTTFSTESMARGMISPVIQKTVVTSTPKKDDDITIIKKVIKGKLVNSRMSVEVVRSNPKSPLYSVKTFEALNLPQELLDGLYCMGFTAPSKIQETALPVLLTNPPQNMIAQSQSGTGKTAAFLLASLYRVRIEDKFPQVLILCPTHELASQVAEVAIRMAKYIPMIEFALSVKGSQVSAREMYYTNQTLKQQVIIGTPGTTLDWILKYKIFDVTKIRVFVLDEADVMMDTQGHRDQSIRIHRCLPRGCQHLLFSATYDDKVMEFANIVVKDPVIIRLKREEESLDNIHQYFAQCVDEVAKYKAVANIFSTISMGQAFIFTATRRSASMLHNKLRSEGFPVGLISGDLTVEERNEVIRKFREGEQRVLIATNVIARGIDVDQVTVVINYDLPLDPETHDIDYETYLHRIGRTGRFGKFGLAINFVDSPKTLSMIIKLEKHFEKKIKELNASEIEALEGINRDDC